LNIFIICPVRNLTREEKFQIQYYIYSLEYKGNIVHYPLRDTNQNDNIGYNICLENAQAIINADEVHVFWNKDSKGSLFDLGMAFITDKKIKLINKIEPTEYKSFENVLLKLESIGRKRC